MAHKLGVIHQVKILVEISRFVRTHPSRLIVAVVIVEAVSAVSLVWPVVAGSAVPAVVLEVLQAPGVVVVLVRLAVAVEM
jgi:hypothetical protein